MACTVGIPAPLRSFSGGLESVELSGRTVRDVLRELGRSYGALYGRVCDPSGEVRSHVNIYLNDVDIMYLGGLDAPISEGDEILLVPAIAGG